VLPERLQQSFAAVPEEELDPLIIKLLALAGLGQESMMRGQGWHFLELGRCLERALQTLSLLRSLWVQSVPAEEAGLLLESALLALDSLLPYRRRYQQHTDLAGALELVLLDGANPRSVLFQLNKLQGHLAALPNAGGGGTLLPQERTLLEASTGLQLAELRQLAAAAEGCYLRSELDQLLARTHYLVSETAAALSDQYFDHSGGPRPLGQGEWAL
jgi:uncharacterized alpha-E superfamily protein